MGVPKFYRWLSERYPLLNQPVKLRGAPGIDNLVRPSAAPAQRCGLGRPAGGARDAARTHGQSRPARGLLACTLAVTTQPPRLTPAALLLLAAARARSGVTRADAVARLTQYLDMNGVIHNCSHGAGTDINTRMGEARTRLRCRRGSCAFARTLMHALTPPLLVRWHAAGRDDVQGVCVPGSPHSGAGPLVGRSALSGSETFCA